MIVIGRRFCSMVLFDWDVMMVSWLLMVCCMLVSGFVIVI